MTDKIIEFQEIVDWYPIFTSVSFFLVTGVIYEQSFTLS